MGTKRPNQLEENPLGHLQREAIDGVIPDGLNCSCTLFKTGRKNYEIFLQTIVVHVVIVTPLICGGSE